MRIITEPSVYLIGHSQVNDQELDRFLSDNDISSWSTDTEIGGEKIVECAGRVCYWSFAKPRPGGNAAYTKHILEVGHGSVLEHSVYTLLITGVSRSLTHELVRHRAGMSYSQLSQRYVDESDCAFVVPPLIERLAADPKHQWLKTNWQRTMQKAAEEYEYLADALLGELAAEAWQEAGAPEQPGMDIEWSEVDHGLCWLKSRPVELKTAIRKAAREAARSVLPNATETKIAVTGNARALRHFIEMRGSAAADAEIRRVALAVLGVLRGASPNLFGDYKLNQVNGEPSVTTPHAKV